MSKKTLLLWVAPLVVVVLVGLACAWLFAGDDLTRQIAVFAATVACGSFVVSYGKAAYDVLGKERDRQKEEDDKKEKIRVKVAYKIYDTTTPKVGVELYNDGGTLVAIKQVVFFLRSEAGQDVRSGLMCRTGEREVEAFGKKSALPAYVHRLKLAPKDHADFFLMTFEPHFRAAPLLSLPAANLWITVESFNGEVARVTGEQIQEAIRSATGR